MTLSQACGRAHRRHGAGSRLPGVLFVALAAWLATPAHAQFQPRAATGLTYSDNVARLPQDKRSGAQAAALAGFRFLELNPRWNADVNAGLAYLRYFNDPSATSDSDTLKTISAFGEVSIVPRAISWELLENYGQVALDPFGAIHPADRQNSNYVTTGPNFEIPLGAVDRLDLQPRYSDVRYSQSDNQNNRRGSATAALVHRWSAIRTVSLNYFAEKVEFFKSDLFRDYKLQSAFVTINSMPRRMRFGIDLGATQVDDGVNKDSSTLAALAFARDLGRYSSIQFYGRRAFTDSADAFRFGQGGGGDQILIDQNVQVVAQPYRETYFSLGYNATLPRSTLTVGPYWVDENYLRNDQLARRRYGGRVDMTYVVSPTVRAAGYVAFEKNKTAVRAQDNEDFFVGLSLVRSFAEAVEAELRFERYDRGSNVTPFIENRAILTLSWAPRLRTPPPSPSDMLFDRGRGTNSQPTDRGQTAAPR